MLSPGCRTNSSSGIFGKNPAAKENFTIPETKFSKTSYKLGRWWDELAKKLHESRYLYALYGALDGLSNICSHWRYLFDLIYNNSDALSDNKLHEFLSSPEGMILVGAEILAIMAYATIGNYFDNNDKNRPLLSFLALTWPYLRDCFKGSKNAFKGIRATLNIASFLSGTYLLPYVVPSALGLGLLAIINRLLMRYMYNQRKKMMKHNKRISLEIEALNTQNLTLEEFEENGREVIGRLQQQSKAVRTLAYIGASYGGFIDGLYLYVGIVTLLGISGLIWLGAPTALFLIGCSVLYGLINIAVRLYEEYDYQKKVDISVAEANLALTGKKIGYLYHHLHSNNEVKLSKENFNTLSKYVETFIAQRQVLRDLSILSYKSACLLGITHGLAAYGALASLIFAISTITFLTIQTLPPVLLLTAAITIGSGLFWMAAFATNAIYKTYCHRQKLSDFETLHTSKSLNELEELKELCEKEVVAAKPDENIEATINDCMVIDAQPLFFWMELWELFRSLFSGIGKGPKSMMTTFNAFQEMGEDGHYHFDSWTLFAFTSVSSCVYAICLALRAYAKGFGRPPVDHIEQPESDKIYPPQNNHVPLAKSSNYGMFKETNAKPDFHQGYHPHLCQNLRFESSSEKSVAKPSGYFTCL